MEHDGFSRFEGTVAFDCEGCGEEITFGWADACITLCDDCYWDDETMLEVTGAVAFAPSDD